MGTAKQELIEKLDELKIYLQVNDVESVKNKENCVMAGTSTLYENKVKDISIAIAN